VGLENGHGLSQRTVRAWRSVQKNHALVEIRIRRVLWMFGFRDTMRKNVRTGIIDPRFQSEDWIIFRCSFTKDNTTFLNTGPENLKISNLFSLSVFPYHIPLFYIKFL
jgi:hypothetical protein